MQLGEVLIDLGLIDQADLDSALQKQSEATDAKPKPLTKKVMDKAGYIAAVMGILGITSIGSVAAKLGVPTIEEISGVVYAQCGEGLETRLKDEWQGKLDICISSKKDIEIEKLTCELKDKE